MKKQLFFFLGGIMALVAGLGNKEFVSVSARSELGDNLAIGGKVLKKVQPVNSTVSCVYDMMTITSSYRSCSTSDSEAVISGKITYLDERDGKIRNFQKAELVVGSNSYYADTNGHYSFTASDCASLDFSLGPNTLNTFHKGWWTETFIQLDFSVLGGLLSDSVNIPMSYNDIKGTVTVPTIESGYIYNIDIQVTIDPVEYPSSASKLSGYNLVSNMYYSSQIVEFGADFVDFIDPNNSINKHVDIFYGSVTINAISTSNAMEWAPTNSIHFGIERIDWETILHEYGHLISDKYGIYNFYTILDPRFWSHTGEENLIDAKIGNYFGVELQDGFDWRILLSLLPTGTLFNVFNQLNFNVGKEEAISLAWNEAVATYFANAALQSMQKTLGANGLYNKYPFTNYESQHANDIKYSQTSSNKIGEGNETDTYNFLLSLSNIDANYVQVTSNSYLRTKLIGTTSGNYVRKVPDINIGFQRVFNLIFVQGSKTLSAFVNKLTNQCFDQIREIAYLESYYAISNSGLVYIESAGGDVFDSAIQWESGCNSGSGYEINNFRINFYNDNHSKYTSFPVSNGNLTKELIRTNTVDAYNGMNFYDMSINQYRYTYVPSRQEWTNILMTNSEHIYWNIEGTATKDFETGIYQSQWFELKMTPGNIFEIPVKLLSVYDKFGDAISSNSYGRKNYSSIIGTHYGKTYKTGIRTHRQMVKIDSVDIGVMSVDNGYKTSDFDGFFSPDSARGYFLQDASWFQNYQTYGLNEGFFTRQTTDGIYGICKALLDNPSSDTSSVSSSASGTKNTKLTMLSGSVYTKSSTTDTKTGRYFSDNIFEQARYMPTEIILGNRRVGITRQCLCVRFHISESYSQEKALIGSSYSNLSDTKRNNYYFCYKIKDIHAMEYTNSVAGNLLDGFYSVTRVA